MNASTYLFADDAKFYKEISCEDDVSGLQADLDKLEKWSETRLLKLHPNKCKVMTVSNKTKLENKSSYHLYNNEGEEVELEMSEGEKDIGVLVDRNLSFSKHIQQKVNKVNSIMELIRRTYTFLDETSFRFLFQALVRPNLEYAAAVWSPYTKKDIELIENVQRRATKQVPSLKQLSYTDRLKKAQNANAEVSQIKRGYD